MDIFQWPQESETIVEAFNKLVVEYELEEVIIADHISYKCADKDSFEGVRAFFEQPHTSKYLYQSFISERRIAIIRLEDVLATKVGPIQYLELSDQKPNNSQVNGCDHIEFVLAPGYKREVFINLIKSTDLTAQLKERPHHTTFDIKYKGFIFRLTDLPLIEKIKQDEMT